MKPHPLAVFAMLSAPLAAVGQSNEGAAPAAAPSLAEELEARAEGFAAQAPAELQARFTQGVEDVRRLRLVETAKNVGDAAPDGELIGPDGGKTTLGALLGEGPLIVTFYRGGWCPYCNLQLRALQRSLGQIEGAGARLVAIAPEIAEKGAETTAKNGLTFTVLTDPDNALAREFGIVFELPESIRPIYEERIGLAEYNGNDKNELPLAATYLLDSQGVIRWAWLDADYKKRAEPADIIEAVEGLE